MEFHSEHELGSRLTLRVFGSPASLAQALAGRVQEAVMNGVRLRGQAHLVIEGAPMLRRCFETLAATALPWGRVALTLLSPPSAASVSEADSPPPIEAAEQLLRSSLLQQHAQAASWRHERDAGITEPAEAPDLVLLALTAEGRLPAWRAAPIAQDVDALAAGPMGLDHRRIVIAAQGLRARDAFERQALNVEASDSALQALTELSAQPIELCWCR